MDSLNSARISLFRISLIISAPRKIQGACSRDSHPILSRFPFKMTQSGSSSGIAGLKILTATGTSLCFDLIMVLLTEKGTWTLNGLLELLKPTFWVHPPSVITIAKQVENFHRQVSRVSNVKKYQELSEIDSNLVHQRHNDLSRVKTELIRLQIFQSSLLGRSIRSPHDDQSKLSNPRSHKGNQKWSCNPDPRSSIGREEPPYITAQKAYALMNSKLTQFSFERCEKERWIIPPYTQKHRQINAYFTCGFITSMMSRCCNRHFKNEFGWSVAVLILEILGQSAFDHCNPEASHMWIKVG